MSTLPRMRERAAGEPAPNGEPDSRPRRPPLSKRLPGMTDAYLASLQKTATRISADDEHPKRGRATIALLQIDAEIERRATGLAAPGLQGPSGPADD